jgi:hypothetical protein
MAHEQAIARYRRWYRELLRLHPEPFRERFGEGMEQTFNDLCRERAEAGDGLFGFVLWMFAETFAGIVRENARNIVRCKMKEDSALFLKTVKYGAIAVSGLMVAGIATVMFLARGTGEDITGVVAPALLMTLVSGVIAIVATIFQKRGLKTIDIKRNNDLTA